MLMYTLLGCCHTLLTTGLSGRIFVMVLCSITIRRLVILSVEELRHSPHTISRIDNDEPGGLITDLNLNLSSACENTAFHSSRSRSLALAISSRVASIALRSSISTNSKRCRCQTVSKYLIFRSSKLERTLGGGKTVFMTTSREPCCKAGINALSILRAYLSGQLCRMLRYR